MHPPSLANFVSEPLPQPQSRHSAAKLAPADPLRPATQCLKPTDSSYHSFLFLADPIAQVRQNLLRAVDITVGSTEVFSITSSHVVRGGAGGLRSDLLAREKPLDNFAGFDRRGREIDHPQVVS